MNIVWIFGVEVLFYNEIIVAMETILSIQKEVGAFLTNLINTELTGHIGRERYERKQGSRDYRNGSYTRIFCIKGIGDVEIRVPRDRDGDFQSQVLPRCQRYDARNLVA